MRLSGSSGADSSPPTVELNVSVGASKAIVDATAASDDGRSGVRTCSYPRMVTCLFSLSVGPRLRL